ncbi:NifU family protein [Streptomyces sp. TRM66268-LWL]|uniref:NifU family protein n=1 Tax=Streptomyces polyasparticus TaxID=2767826 RepID=A0ABR7SEI8_9ACTN|nr:NifU family protein [Streptomyces polyasparticus]MBC9713926.1 NifU family protein [Streptomyces polyasparticus]
MDELRAVEARVAELVRRLSATPQVGDQAEELVRLLMRLYGAGLARITALLSPEDVARLTADDLVGSLLILHDLHPRPTVARVEEALAKARAQVGADPDGIVLLGVEDRDVIRVRLGAAVGRCPSSLSAVRQIVDQAVAAVAPEVAEIRLEPSPREPELLQILPGPPRSHDAAAPR